MNVSEEGITKAIDFLRDKLSDEDLATFEELARSYVEDDDEIAADGVPRPTPLIRLARRSALARRGGGMASDSRPRSRPREMTEAERLAFDERFPNAKRIGTPEGFGMQVRKPYRIQSEAEKRAFETRFPDAARLK